jgi:hypothetical protein
MREVWCTLEQENPGSADTAKQGRDATGGEARTLWSGMGRSDADHRRWTNAFFADVGLFTMQAAHAAARHSR